MSWGSSSQAKVAQLLAGTGVRGHVGVWGRILLFSPTVWAGEEGHTQEHAHTEERTCECCSYPLATHPLVSARGDFRDRRQDLALQLRQDPENVSCDPMLDLLDTQKPRNETVIECFRGRHKGGGAILLHFCGSPDPFFMQ